MGIKRKRNIRAAGVLNKNTLGKCTIIWDKQLQKSGYFEQRTSSKKSSITLTAVGQTDNRSVYISSSKSCEAKRFAWCWNKFERKYIQEQQADEFHCYNQNMEFVNRMDQNVAKYRIGIRMKKWCWSSFA